MRPTVWLRQDQAQEAIRDARAGTPPGARANALAFGLDAGTVFHVHLSPPAVRVHGEPTACRVVCLPDHAALAGAARAADEFFSGSRSGGAEWSWQQGLAVFLALDDDNRVHAEAFRASEGGPIACDVQIFHPGFALGSRSRGLIETELLATKRVAVVGLGSGGSTVALELAKAGVGRFDLFDFDRLEPSNIARHICGASDLGRMKTAAVRDALLDRAPLATVTAHDIDITKSQAHFREGIAQADLIIAATDNRASRALINDAAVDAGVTAVFGRALTRAAGGDVLRVRPRRGPCLACVFEAGLMRSADEEVSTFRQARAAAPDYVSDGDANATVQPGLSADIAPISTMMVKLALVELSRGHDVGITTLEDDLVADFYVWANRRDRVYRSWAPMGFGFDKPAVLRWYGARVARDTGCPVCGERAHHGAIDPLFQALG